MGVGTGLSGGQTGGHPHGGRPPGTAAWRYQLSTVTGMETTIMFVIAALALVFALVLAIVGAVTMFGAAAHLLFSPWLLLVAVGVFAWIKFRPGRGRR